MLSWKNQLEILSKIAEIQPQAAYSAYMFRLKNKFTLFLQTVPDIANYLLLIKEILRSYDRGDISLDTESAFLALPVKFGGLGLQNFCKVANIELLNSKKITRGLYENVVTQNKELKFDSEKTRTIKIEKNEKDFKLKDQIRKSEEFYERENETL